MTGHSCATFVKICGITRVEEARVAAQAGANAIGFVFARGPRKVSGETAAKIAAHIHPSVTKIGVFVDADLPSIQARIEQAALDGVQLHGSEDLALVRRLKMSFPRLMVFKALKVDGRESAEAIQVFAGEVDAVMLDRKDVRHPDRRVGQIPLDWLDGRPLDRVILAGGLTPENVAEAVERLKPWGVDASSGLETKPGVKDAEKVSAFVRAVRRVDTGGP